MKKKKIISIIISTAMMIGLLSGCGTNDAKEPEAPSNEEKVTTEVSSDKEDETASKEKVVLACDEATTFADGVDAWVAGIEAATGVEIELYPVPTDYNSFIGKATTQLSSGDDTIDIYHVNDEIFASMKVAGYLDPLDDIMTEEVLENFPTAYLEDIVRVNGKIMSVPSYLDLLVLFANTDMMKEAGVESIETKEDFLNFATAATKDGVYGYGGTWFTEYVYNELGTFINLFGGDFYDWTNPKTQEAMKFMYDMLNEYKVVSESIINDDYGVMMQKLIDRQCGMEFMWTGGLNVYESAGRYAEDQITIIPMPTFETSDCYVGSWHFVLNSASKNKNAAKKVLAYLAGYDGQMAYTNLTGRIPARTDIIMDDSFQAAGADKVREYVKDCTALRGRPLVPQTMDLISGCGTVFQKYVTNEITLEECVEQGQAIIDDLT